MHYIVIIKGGEQMDLFMTDTLLYVSYALVTTFFLCASYSFFKAQSIHKNVRLQQDDIYLIQNINPILTKILVFCIYSKYKLVQSVHRQESSGEQDDEGPYSPVY
jgi:hypothetical protein